MAARADTDGAIIGDPGPRVKLFHVTITHFCKYGFSAHSRRILDKSHLDLDNHKAIGAKTEQEKHHNQHEKNKVTKSVSHKNNQYQVLDNVLAFSTTILPVIYAMKRTILFNDFEIISFI